MKTILVTGNDTGIGKTKIVSALVNNLLSNHDGSIQVIKPIECGYTDINTGDIKSILEANPSDRVTGNTLFSFKEPQAPLIAAKRENRPFTFDQVIKEINQLPSTDWRIIEGAGGIAVPLCKTGKDWSDLAISLNVDHTLLVVDNRLGTVNQSRLLYAYAKSKNLEASLFLNEVTPLDEGTRHSNQESLEELGIPIFAELKHGESEFIPRSTLVN